MLQFFLDALSDFVFPDVCMLCNQPLWKQHHHVCTQCLEHEVQVSDEFLLSPALRLPTPKPVLFQWSCWTFQKKNSIQQLLHELKYGGKPGLGIDMGYFAAEKSLLDQACNLALLDQPLMVPVPLHPKKERIRGYNQAKMVAQGMANFLQTELIEDHIVRRNRHTKTQTGLSIQQRQANLASVFSVSYNSKIKDRDLILVDDVFTTGATTYELASALRLAGAANMVVLTLAMA